MDVRREIAESALHRARGLAALERHQSPRQTVQWSIDMLTPQERQLLTRRRREPGLQLGRAGRQQGMPGPDEPRTFDEERVAGVTPDATGPRTYTPKHLADRILTFRAVAHGGHIPLLPILEIFSAYFEIMPQDDDRRANHFALT